MTYLGVARNILEVFPIPKSTAAAELPDGSEFRETMAERLLVTSDIYTDEYFQSSTYPVKFL